MSVQSFIGGLDRIALSSSQSAAIGSGRAGSMAQRSEKSPDMGFIFKIGHHEYEGAGWVNTKNGKEFISCRFQDDAGIRYFGFLRSTKANNGLIGNVWYESKSPYQDKADFSVFVSQEGEVAIYPPMPVKPQATEPVHKAEGDDDIVF